jgi:hypothetical protein
MTLVNPNDYVTAYFAFHGARTSHELGEAVDVDAHSDEDGQPFQRKLGTCSNGSWAAVPLDVGQLAARAPMAAVG